jgi:hypothetical protein
VTDILRKNPEVGTVVPKDATSRVGVFLLNNSGLCAIPSASTTHGAKEKRCSYVYLITIARKRLLLIYIYYMCDRLTSKSSYMLK